MSAAFFAQMKELTARVAKLEQEIAQLKAQAQESSTTLRLPKQESSKKVVSG
jgi:cell division protein FtsB